MDYDKARWWCRTIRSLSQTCPFTTDSCFKWTWKRSSLLLAVVNGEVFILPLLTLSVCDTPSKQSFAVKHLLLSPFRYFLYQLSAQSQGEHQVPLFELISSKSNFTIISDSSCTNGIAQCSWLHGRVITAFIIWASQIDGTTPFRIQISSHTSSLPFHSLLSISTPQRITESSFHLQYLLLFEV